ncbi:MAG: hypothetical protein ABEK36_02970 [Candidatus Aenigmatarchaeota archaeon]
MMANKDLIKEDFSEEYEITDDKVKFNGKEIDLGCLPIMDKMKEMGDQEIVSGTLHKIHDRYNSLCSFLCGSTKFEDVYNNNKEEADKFAEELENIAEKYDLSPENSPYCISLLDLDNSYIGAFGEDPFEWAVPSLKIEENK